MSRIASSLPLRFRATASKSTLRETNGVAYHERECAGRVFLNDCSARAAAKTFFRICLLRYLLAASCARPRHRNLVPKVTGMARIKQGCRAGFMLQRDALRHSKARVPAIDCV